MTLKKELSRALALLSAVGFAACNATSGAQVATPKVTSVNPVAQSSLTLAVGTANINGTPGLNVVSTLRQPNGNSSVLVDSPTLTGPLAFTQAAAGKTGSGNATGVAGPSASELAQGGIITSTPQTTPGTPSSAITTTTFGQRGGVFGMGLAPYNYGTNGAPAGTGSGATGLPGYSAYAPYPVPLYATKTSPTFLPWGGPPAFDPKGTRQGTRDGTYPNALAGFAEGITVFQGVTANPGTYTLGVSIPVGFNGDVAQFGSPTPATATLTSGPAPVLPVIAPPVVTLDGSGGGSFTQVFPAGVTEVYVQLVNQGNGGSDNTANANTLPNCYASGGPAGGLPVFYTFRVRNTDAQPIAIPSNMGPATVTGGKQPTFCTSAANAAAVTAAGLTAGVGTPSTGDNFSSQTIGFNYSLYSIAYPFSTAQTPNVKLGPNGQDDITISAQGAGVSP